MNNSVTSPDTCTTMAEVRDGVDAVDAEIGRLLGLRFGYMRAAARIKPARTAIRDEGRKAQVIANALAHGRSFGSPEDAVERLYDHLVEESIAYEFEEWDRLQKE